MRILQVEANRDAAIAVEGLVTAGGSTCDTVATAQLALKRLVFEDYDLILTAFVLPDFSGADFIAQLDAAGIGAAVIVRMRNQPVADAYAEALQRLAGTTDSQDEGPAAAAAEADFQRDSVRHKIIKSGQIVYRDAYCVMDCTILNVSASGACIKPADVFEDPGPFTLKISNGPSRRCEVRWRRSGKIGVRFVQ